MRLERRSRRGYCRGVAVLVAPRGVAAGVGHLARDARGRLERLEVDQLDLKGTFCRLLHIHPS